MRLRRVSGSLLLAQDEWRRILSGDNCPCLRTRDIYLSLCAHRCVKQYQEGRSFIHKQWDNGDMVMSEESHSSIPQTPK